MPGAVATLDLLVGAVKRQHADGQLGRAATPANLVSEVAQIQLLSFSTEHRDDRLDVGLGVRCEPPRDRQHSYGLDTWVHT